MAQGELARKIVAIGGSAGSLDVILKIFSALTSGTGASYVIIIHRKHDMESVFAALLGTRTRMPVVEVEDKERILPDHIYVAPPDYHLLLENENMFSLDSSEKVHFSRPSIDVTFESVAEVYGSRAIGVLLSGANADGAEGLKKIKTAGGLTIVQDPSTADVSFMPEQAIRLNAQTMIIAAGEIGQCIKDHLL